MHQLQSQLLATANHQKANQQQHSHKQLSQSFRDILENTMLINGFSDMSLADEQRLQQNIYEQHQQQNFFRNQSHGTMPRNTNKSYIYQQPGLGNQLQSNHFI
jgi:hypothetical protein